MTALDIFSKRQKDDHNESSDLYSYDSIPQALKVQIVHMLEEIFNNRSHVQNQMKSQLYSISNKKLCKEYGVFHLLEDDYEKDPHNQIINFFLKNNNLYKSIDIIEYLTRGIIHLNKYYYGLNPIVIENFISELNHRFKQHNVGYRFESGQIIRIDNEIIHSEAVKPSLSLLRDPIFKNANDEFLVAHEHLRYKRYKECIADCCKALESTLKIICQINGWDIKPKDGASRLIDKCLKNGLLPSYLETQFTSLKSVLESGIPTIRNNTSSHGQGSETIEVPEYLAQYALNLTASAIVFLVNAHNNAVPEETPSL